METELVILATDPRAEAFAIAASKKSTVKNGQSTYLVLGHHVRPDYSVKYRLKKVFG